LPAQTDATAPVSEPADAVYETAHQSLEARRGLGTVRQLLERIDHTRQLLWAWEQAGRYVSKPRRRLNRVAEQNDLVRRLKEISEIMDGFPKILGQPGQPGYRLIAFARLEMTGPMFSMLDPIQREALARDWLAGRVLLLSHRQFLRRELKAYRHLPVLKRWLRPARAAVNDHPGWVLLAVALAALALAVFYLN
jgi:hypothetical protein